MILIDGRKAREYYIPILQGKIKAFSFIPQLAIIQVGNRSDSDSFIKAKKSFAKKISVREIHVQLADTVTQDEIIAIIKKYNQDLTVQGIIVQLPLPIHLNQNTIIDSIDLKKDVDGLVSGTSFIPATARGIGELFDFYNIDLKNKNVAVIGRSRLVGSPIARMCEKRGAHVTVCHKGTENISEITRKTDIVIVAIGQPKLIDEKYFSNDQIVIDVGITKIDGVIYGDVDFEKVKDTVSMITPVPGGVGQMTVLALFENLVDAC
jgi:methylenetetrahydrofolate dehydrogenase (NADP+)/methenyltetrahydrofolate cyclohydrolase